jgi:hypothetical protein
MFILNAAKAIISSLNNSRNEKLHIKAEGWKRSVKMLQDVTRPQIEEMRASGQWDMDPVDHYYNASIDFLTRAIKFGSQEHNWFSLSTLAKSQRLSASIALTICNPKFLRGAALILGHAKAPTKAPAL